MTDVTPSTTAVRISRFAAPPAILTPTESAIVSTLTAPASAPATAADASKEDTMTKPASKTATKPAVKTTKAQLVKAPAPKPAKRSAKAGGPTDDVFVANEKAAQERLAAAGKTSAAVSAPAPKLPTGKEARAAERKAAAAERKAKNAEQRAKVAEKKAARKAEAKAAKLADATHAGTKERKAPAKPLIDVLAERLAALLENGPGSANAAREALTAYEAFRAKAASGWSRSGRAKLSDEAVAAWIREHRPETRGHAVKALRSEGFAISKTRSLRIWNTVLG